MRTALVVVGLAACGGGGSGTPDAPAVDGPPDAAPVAGCPRTAAPADRVRRVIVSHPYDAQGNQAGGYEVLELGTDGKLTRPNRTFTMGRSITGTIAFTPDGQVAIAALESGKLGVVRLDAAGIPAVVHAEFGGTFYATRVVMDPRGDRAIILDGNTRENGGGIYMVTIACDGTLTDHGMIAKAKLPGGIAFAGDQAVLAAADALDSAAGNTAHLLAWGDAPALVGGANAFGDDMAIVGGVALTPDKKTFLIGDVSQFSGIPNRVAVVEVNAASMKPIAKLPVEDPEAIAMSPFGPVAVVASAFSDKLFVLDTGGADGVWRVRGEVTYKGGKPQLPGDVASIDRGALAGHVLVSENVSVRHLAFHADGTVEDLGSLAFGDGLQNISGAIGVEP